MASFGEGLKREREKKKITLEQVSVSTKISVRLLRAIEEEKFDQLPGGMFNKAFVRAYARQLGIDEEQAVADYLATSTPAEPPQFDDRELRAMAEQKDKERQRQARMARDFPWGWVASALLVIALGLSIWGVRFGREPQSATTNGKTVTGHLDQAGTVAPAPAAVAPDAQRNLRSGAGGKIAAPQYTPAASSDGSRSAISTESGAVDVLVSAEEDSWVSITADGNPIFTGTLIAPGEHLVHANKSVVIRAGNLGGLDFSFNGKKLPSQGDYGEAKTLMFDSTGLKPPPPAQQDNSNAAESR